MQILMAGCEICLLPAGVVNRICEALELVAVLVS
ncbi:hypothetical protein HNR50_000669 [Spirochaeta isovalerica]|uniref:Uncharacterized protein n=1 Tax=Spirochaeta isovalerica TaxID=150 RepID=A0A841R5D5_9SPIO|nr:hypothetical protein [Spirochaeta isovalerica]